MPGPRGASEGSKKEPYSNKDRTASSDNLGFRSIDDFEQGDILGRGSFCRVVRCTDCISGRECALKLAPKGDPAVDAACAMEAHCLRRLARSPLIVSLLWDMDDGIQWVAVLELCDGGELWSLVQHCGCLMEGESAWYGSQMVEALAAVHAVGIVHRDVRCENFLLCCADHSVKLIDFGTARDTNHPGLSPIPVANGESEHCVGDPHFMAPEAASGEVNDRRSDLWSLGCALYQLVLGAPPFRAPSPTLVQARVQAADLWFPKHSVHSREKDLITSLVRREPDHRMGARHTRKVLLHPLLQDPPLEFPADTLLVRGLRRVACAVDQEAAALEASPWDVEVGAATASLLKELPAALGIDANAVQEKISGMQPRMLSRFAEPLSASAKSPGSPRNSPRSTLAKLALAGGASSDEAGAAARSGQSSPRSSHPSPRVDSDRENMPRVEVIATALGIDEGAVILNDGSEGSAEAVGAGDSSARSQDVASGAAAVAVGSGGGQGALRVGSSCPRHSPGERALLEVVHVAAVQAAEAGAPHELGLRLSKICFDAARGGSEAVPVALLLPGFAYEHVARFAEMAQQRLAQSLPRPYGIVSDCDSEKVSSVPTVAAEGQRADDEGVPPESSSAQSLQKAAGDLDEDCLADGLLGGSSELNLSKSLADESPMVPPNKSIAVSLRRPGMAAMGTRPWGGSVACDTGPSPVFLPCAEAEPHPPPEPASPATTVDTQANVAVEIQDEQAGAVKAKEEQADVSLTQKPLAPGRRRCCVRRKRG